MIRLEIGPGPNRLPGYTTVSAAMGPAVDHLCRWGEQPLPFEDGSVEIVYASHVLEHVPWHRTVEALREAHRVLEVSGLLEVWVPDFAKIVAAYRMGECGDTWLAHNPRADPMLWVNGRIFTRGPGWENYHRAVFDRWHLTRCLTTAGFPVVYPLTTPRGTDHGPISLGLGAVKMPPGEVPCVQFVEHGDPPP